MGEACAFCADGRDGTLRSYRQRGKCKKCPDVIWLPWVMGALVLLFAGPALRTASQMQDGFGAINIAVAFSQVIAIFRQLEMQWPSQLLELFDVLSLFNLNVDLLSIDCFVEWTWVRKFFLANVIPLVLGGFFLIRVCLKVFHNKFFLPKVYVPAALYVSTALGMHAAADEIRSASQKGISPFASVIWRGGDSASTPRTPEDENAAEETTRVGSPAESQGQADANASDADVNAASTPRRGRFAAMVSKVSISTLGSGRLAALVSEVSSPRVMMKARMLKAASSLLSPVDEDKTVIFKRRMQSAFLLFLSWAYMALAQINVEYYSCTETSDGRSFLDMDPGVQCWVGDHLKLWVPAMAGTLFYVIGIPLYFALTLFQHRRLLSVRDLIDDAHPSFGELVDAEQRFGFLFRRYEAEYHWWELMFFFRKLALVTTQAFFTEPLDQCLLTMLAIIPGMLGVVRAKPYDSAALDVMEWVACSSSFIVLFCGFLFFSELLTPGDRSVVLWFTVVLVVLTYLIIVGFVAYDLFPYGVRIYERYKFWLEARRSRSGMTTAQAEASYRERNRKRRARELLLRRVRGNARLVFRKATALCLEKAVHEFESMPPDDLDSTPAPAGRDPSLKEVLDLLEILSVNIKRFNEEDDDDEVELLSPTSEADSPVTPSKRTPHRKERSRARALKQANFLRSPSLNRMGSIGGSGRRERKLVGSLLSEIKMVVRSFAREVSRAIGRAREGQEDNEFKRQQISEIIDERIRVGTLKPPALGDGVVREEAAAFFADELPFRVSRALFIKVLMILEYLRLKEAGDADPFWATANGRAMLMEHALLGHLEPVPDTFGGDTMDADEDVAAHLAAVRYRDVLFNHLKKREGEDDLDMNAAGRNPLNQLGSQVSSYSGLLSL